MKQQKHKHKESYSLLLVSNTDGSSKQLHITLFSIRLLFALLFVLIAAFILLVWQFSQSRREQDGLRVQLAEQEELLGQLKTEKETLTNENQALEAENNDLRQVSRIITARKEDEEEAEEDTALPTLFPSSGSGMLITMYSEEQPFLSLNTHTEGKIIATADGSIVTVGSDDTYPLIIEVEHENGYRTRYMCHEAVQMQLEEGAQVRAGDVLCTVLTDNTQLDYQILLEGEPIDPLNIIDAKG